MGHAAVVPDDADLFAQAGHGERPGEVVGAVAVLPEAGERIEELPEGRESINDPDILEDGYRYAVKFFQTRPYPNLDEVRAVLDEYKSMPQAANAKPEQFIDLSLLQALEKKNFSTNSNDLAARTLLSTILPGSAQAFHRQRSDSYWSMFNPMIRPERFADIASIRDVV